MPLDQLVNEFLEYLEIEKNVSKLTVRNYRHYLARFIGFLGRSDGPDSPPPSPAEASTKPGSGKTFTLSDISQEKIRGYRLYLSRLVDASNMTLKRVTQNYHLIALRSFLKFLVKRGYRVLPADSIELGKAESRSLKFLEREQIERLLAMPDIAKLQGLRDKAILEVLFSTGLRVSELVSLNRDSLNLDRREFGVIGKGKRPRVVFLSEKEAD